MRYELRCEKTEPDGSRRAVIILHATQQSDIERLIRDSQIAALNNYGGVWRLYECKDVNGGIVSREITLGN